MAIFVRPICDLISVVKTNYVSSIIILILLALSVLGIAQVAIYVVEQVFCTIFPFPFHRLIVDGFCGKRRFSTHVLLGRSLSEKERTLGQRGSG